MTWKNVSRDQLPENNAEVIISVNGVNYLSVFCASNATFRTHPVSPISSIKPMSTLFIGKIPSANLN
jgi:hypothetical protein